MPVNELPTMRDLFAYANENVWTVMVGVVIVLVAVKLLFGDSDIAECFVDLGLGTGTLVENALGPRDVNVLTVLVVGGTLAGLAPHGHACAAIEQ